MAMAVKYASPSTELSLSPQSMPSRPAWAPLPSILRYPVGIIPHSKWFNTVLNINQADEEKDLSLKLKPTSSINKGKSTGINLEELPSMFEAQEKIPEVAKQKIDGSEKLEVPSVSFPVPIHFPVKKLVDPTAAAAARRRRKELTKIKYLQGRQSRLQG